MDATEGEWSDDFSFLMIVIELTDAGHGEFFYGFNEIIDLRFDFCSLKN